MLTFYHSLGIYLPPIHSEYKHLEGIDPVSMLSVASNIASGYKNHMANKLSVSTFHWKIWYIKDKKAELSDKAIADAH